MTFSQPARTFKPGIECLAMYGVLAYAGDMNIKQTLKRLLLVIVSTSLLLWGCSCNARPPETQKPAFDAVGLASYYGKKLHGRKTASGERYNPQAFTAAHRRLPFGTRVRVTRLKDGRSVTVRINDRGPFVKGRIIDLSYAAARQLGILSAGVANVGIRVVSN